MTKIVFYKWQPGFDKIGFYRLLRKELGYSLATAKKTVDLLMEGKTIEIELTSPELAEQILRQAEQLGAVGGKVSIARPLLEQLSEIMARQFEQPFTNIGKKQPELKRLDKLDDFIKKAANDEQVTHLPMKYRPQNNKGDIRYAR